MFRKYGFAPIWALAPVVKSKRRYRLVAGLLAVSACVTRRQPSHHEVPENRLRREFYLAWWFDYGRAQMRGWNPSGCLGNTATPYQYSKYDLADTTAEDAALVALSKILNEDSISSARLGDSRTDRELTAKIASKRTNGTIGESETARDPALVILLARGFHRSDDSFTRWILTPTSNSLAVSPPGCDVGFRNCLLLISANPHSAKLNQ